MSPADLMTLLDNAIRRRGDKFWNDLVKDRPVVAAQLRQVLLKTRGGVEDSRPVNILMPEGMAGFAAAIMAPPAGADLSGLDADALRAEVSRLQQENDRLKRAASGLEPLKPQDDEPLLPVPSKEAVECFSCEHRTAVKGRMIEPLGVCPFCGQTHADSVAQRYTPPAPPQDVQPGGGVAFSIPLDGGSEAGWVSVDTTHGLVPGIREALDQGDRRGPF